MEEISLLLYAKSGTDDRQTDGHRDLETEMAHSQIDWPTEEDLCKKLHLMANTHTTHDSQT